MEFGPVPLDQAAGAILAHSTGPLRKGRVLTPADIATLRASGFAEVTVARPGPQDLHEDPAATRIAQALVPDPVAQGMRLTAAATGRVNLYATTPGIVLIDVPAIHALNRINPMITLATVPPFQRVEAGGMIATIKIIAYGLSEADVTRAAVAGQGALRLARPVHETAALIETTTIGDIPPSKGREALRLRLSRLGLRLEDRVIARHETTAIASALKASRADVIFILTASATSDARDVAPQGLRAAGGRVAHFGMPVDPGNLLFFGYLGARPVIGLPGCARSPALNGADWVLERLICGQALGPDDIAAMGVGGLLKEIAIRPRPREA